MDNSVIDLSFIKDEFFPTKSSRKINNGDCFNFCWIAYLLYPEQTLLFSDSEYIHAFVKINNLFYDSESPTGIDDWKKLSFYIRHPEYNKCFLMPMTYGKFYVFWKKYGKNNKMLDKIPRMVKCFLEKTKENLKGK